MEIASAFGTSPTVGDQDAARRRCTPLLLTLLALLPIGASLVPQFARGADAGPPIEEIIVRGEMVRTRLLESAAAVSIITAETLSSRGARHFEDVVDLVPNLNYAGGTGRARFFQIRGIGERSQFSEPLNPSVGILLDGIDLSGAAAALTLFDTARVEVLRGPQGTRYGANALAGLIHVTSADPTPTFAARAELGGSTYGGRTLAGVVSGPLGERMGGRLAVQQHDSDGYYRNDFLGIDDNNRRDEFGARAIVEFDHAPGHTTRITLMHVDVDNGYDAFTLDNSRRTLADEPGFDRQRTSAVALSTTHALGAVDLSVLAHFADSDLDYGFDEDWTWTGIHPFGYSSTDAYYRDRRTSSAEVRLAAPDGFAWGNAPGHWLVGLYRLQSDVTLQRRYTFLPAPFASTNAFDSTAAFADFGVEPVPRWRLSGGLRVERRATSYDDSDGLAFEPVTTLWGGNIDLAYELGRDTRVLLRVSRGYKAGGVNADGTLPESLRQFDSEQLLESSLALKSVRLDGRLSVQLTAFHSWRRDQQARNSLVLPRPDGSTEFVDFIDNAAAGANAGLELETLWRIVPGLRATIAAGWLDATFDRYVNVFDEDLSGRQQAQAPDFTYAIALEGERGPWFARVSLDGRNGFFFSDRHDLRATSRHLLGARIGWRRGGLSASLWARNLTDRDYTIRGFGTFGNDPRKGYEVEPYVQFGEPRVIGVDLRHDLGEP